MSAAPQLNTVWAAGRAEAARQAQERQAEARQREAQRDAGAQQRVAAGGLAFYRRHTESMLRRYLYASIQVGRAPSLLNSPVGRGWASSRPVRSFEDAVIFVLDVERCIKRLDAIDQQLLSRIVLQEYTQLETAAMLGMCVRTVSSRLAKAVDHLTEQLLTAGLLILPE